MNSKANKKNIWRWPYSSFLLILPLVLFGTVQTVKASTVTMGTPISSFVLGPTTPGKWGNPTMGTPGGLVTWSLIFKDTSCEGDCTRGKFSALSDFSPAGFEADIEAVFALWSAVADISFMQVDDDRGSYDSKDSPGDIRIGGHMFPGSSTLAHGFFPPENGVSAAGDIHFNDKKKWIDDEFDMTGNKKFDFFTVMLHESGHALGLAHSNEVGSVMQSVYAGARRVLSTGDIAGIQAIYTPIPATIFLFVSGLAVLAALYGLKQGDDASSEPEFLRRGGGMSV